MKRKIGLLLLAVVLGLSGCSFGINFRLYDDTNCEIGNIIGEDAPKVLEIEWVSGEIEVVGGDAFSVIEQADKLPRGQRMHWTHDEHTGKIHVYYCESGYTGKTIDEDAKDLVVTLPADAAPEVKISAVSSPVRLAHEHYDELEVYTVSGEIHAANLTAQDVELESVSGEIEAETVYAREDTHLATVSGNILLEGTELSDDLTLESVSGTIRAEKISARSVEVNSTSGNVHLSFAEGIHPELHTDTVSGSVKDESSRSVDKRASTIPVEVETVSGNIYVK